MKEEKFFTVAPWKEEWQHGKENMRNFLPESDYLRLKNNGIKILYDLKSIDATSANQNIRAVRYYDYFKTDFPDLFPSFYGVFRLDKIVDGRDFQLDSLLIDGLVYDAYTSYLDHIEHNELAEAKMYKDIALNEKTIYAIDYFRGWYQVIDDYYLDGLVKFLVFICQSEDYWEYQYKITDVFVAFVSTGYANIKPYLAAKEFPALNWDLA